jgi:hypothetical protein
VIELTTAFYLPVEDLDWLRSLDPDRDWKLLRRRERWVLQTFLRLRAAGMDVALVGEVPPEGVLVFHAFDRHSVRRSLHRGSRTTLVGIRGDSREITIADVEVVQNGLFSDGRRCVFLPYWPQPGIIPRDEGRRQRVECVAFMGFDLNLHPDFTSPEWSAWLEQQGMEWAFRSMSLDDALHGVSVDWHDYSQVDAVLALRPDPESQHDRKPASKLYNAWHAGVPALLGPEYAYRELRRSELDYIEILSRADAEQAIQRLRADPELYRAMVDNGRVRAKEFSVARTVEKWRELLEVTLPSLVSPGRRPPYWMRSAARKLSGLVRSQHRTRGLPC